MRKIKLSALIIINTFFFNKPDLLSTDVVENIIEKIANVFSESVVKVSEVTAIGGKISVDVVKSSHGLVVGS